MIFHEDNDLSPTTQAGQNAMIDEHLAYDKELDRHGHYIASNALEPGEHAVSVKVREGKTLVTDGPFIETKELTGIFLIEAADMQKAIELASKIPSARTGKIEVRPVRHLE
ncbi:MAG: hypothetical protein KIS88_00810 [Anaerolineales bacterium]|nr:hypothetical protein [Anaerolineales bacterium]